MAGPVAVVPWFGVSTCTYSPLDDKTSSPLLKILAKRDFEKYNKFLVSRYSPQNKNFLHAIYESDI
jgi:hypothetical protein